MQPTQVFIVQCQAGGAIVEVFSSRELADNCIASHEAMTPGGLTIEHWNVETSPIAPPASVIQIRRTNDQPQSA
jgi:hypothetical protein